MSSVRRYRTVIYAGTVLTGLSGLIYQVVWQKYLTFLVGSETRSVSLVVAVFLAGLACGYRFWGSRTERATDRRTLLRTYGLIELGIGAYAALFPLYLEAVTWLAHRAPSWLVTDLLLAALTLLAPTFLMGATIPLLVSVVPESSGEVHLCHAKIYGVNTLGACLGAFVASFVLIPRFGLQSTLWLASGANLVAGVLFVFNRLRGPVSKERPVEALPHRFPPGAIYAYTLVTGTVTLSLEVLCVRLLGLAIGSGPHNFAIVVGVFILGLALGSLLLTGRLLTVRVMFRAMTLLVLYLIVLFHSVPYWPYWLSNMQAALQPLPVNYTVYLLGVTGFLALVLLPFLVPLGTMLPFVYALLPKSATDYGKKCGWIYFYNTLGTALGAILLSYLALYALELDQVFKLDLALLAALAIGLLLCERRRAHAALIGIATAAFLVGPGWDRASHYIGLFRAPEPRSFNFQGWLRKPNLAPRVVFFEDGPDSTVTVVEHGYAGQAEPGPDGRPVPVTSRALVINGNPDGDTLSDYSTNTLAALLPYLHAPARSGLEATVVGLGTGMTTGTLALAEDVARVTAVEISATLVSAMPAFAAANHGIAARPDVTIVAADGFKHFSRANPPQDIVVSATSPAWVVGVENLLTPEFYALARGALKDDGVFLQWFPLYAMDDVQFRTILANLQQVFPHRRLWRISLAEMGILASATPLREPDARRFFEPGLAEVRAGMQLDDPAQLALIDLFDSADLDFLARSGPTMEHALPRPRLSYASDRLRFVQPVIDWNRFVDPRLLRLTHTTEARLAAFASLVARYPDGQPCQRPTLGPQLFCTRYQTLWQARETLVQPVGSVPLRQQIEAYDRLRQEGVHPVDREFLARVVDAVVAEPQANLAATEAILGVYANDALWDDGRRYLALLLERRIIAPDYHGSMLAQLESRRRARESFLQEQRGG